MRHPLAITVLAGLFLLAAAFLVGGRYDSHVTEGGALVRVDRFTSAATACMAQQCVRIADGPPDFSDKTTR